MEDRLAPLLADVLENHAGSGTGSGTGSGPRRASPDLVASAPPRGSVRGGKDLGKDRLYGSVVAAAVLRSGLGSPADPAVIREANGAVRCGSQ